MLGAGVFLECSNLKRALLNEGLRVIGPGCFIKTGLEEVAIPGSVRKIDYKAFLSSSLKCVRFLSSGSRS